MTQLLTQLSQKVGQKVLDGAGRFLDWPSTVNQEGVHAGLQAMLIVTLNDGAAGKINTTVQSPTGIKVIRVQ